MNQYPNDVEITELVDDPVPSTSTAVALRPTAGRSDEPQRRTTEVESVVRRKAQKGDPNTATISPLVYIKK